MKTIECSKNFVYTIFLLIFTIFSVTSCRIENNVHNKYKYSETELNSILASFIGKTPNQLYLSLDKPDEYLVKMDSHNKITSAEISYNYIYNFDTKQFDCKITFITDKRQQMISGYKYSSNICLQITLY